MLKHLAALIYQEFIYQEFIYQLQALLAPLGSIMHWNRNIF